MKEVCKILILLSVCVSCTKKTPDTQTGPAIDFSPSLTATVTPVKAELYDSDNLISEDHKGNFSVAAYISGTKDKHFLNTERVFYMYYPEDPAASKWRFYDSGSNSFYERYWPVSYSLDFLAYMPYDLADTHVTLNLDTQEFSCILPLDKTNQDSAHEFIYAFETGKSSDTNNGVVTLEFRHPFSAVNFTLGQAHGNTEIHSVGLTGICNAGTFSIADGAWSYSDATADMDIEVGKTVGIAGSTGIQLNSHIGGPYLIMPQQTDDLSLTVSFTWNEERTDAVVPLGDGEWLPGYIYTYKLNLGDNQEDIITDVTVIPWKVIDYRNDIDVE